MQEVEKQQLDLEVSTSAPIDQFPIDLLEHNENLNFEIKDFKFGSSKPVIADATAPKRLSPSSESLKDQDLDTPSIKRTSPLRSYVII